MNIKELKYFLISSGVKHFPINKTKENNTKNENIIKNIDLNLEKCNLCDLKSQRKNVLFTKELNYKPYFFISEYPNDIDENEKILFAGDKGLNSVLGRLINKLNINDKIFRSYLVKCVPFSGITNKCLEICSKHLFAEIEAVLPEIIFIFGQRPFRILEKKYNMIYLENFAENTLISKIFINNKEIKIAIFPSAMELEININWRLSCWQSLTFLLNNSLPK